MRWEVMHLEHQSYWTSCIVLEETLLCYLAAMELFKIAVNDSTTSKKTLFLTSILVS